MFTFTEEDVARFQGAFGIFHSVGIRETAMEPGIKLTGTGGASSSLPARSHHGKDLQRRPVGTRGYRRRSVPRHKRVS